MPDYDLSLGYQVNVTVYGKILDDKYTRLLYQSSGTGFGDGLSFGSGSEKERVKNFSAEAVSF